MRISNPNFSVLCLGVSAFDRLGLEDYLPNSTILSLNESTWVEVFPKLSKRVLNINKIFPDIGTDASSTKKALANLDWNKIVEKTHANYLLIYKPVKNQEVFEEQTGIKVLSNTYDLFMQLENKANFRNFISQSSFFPKYKIIDYSQLVDMSFTSLFQEFGEFVIQDENLSGGRGTFIIKDVGAYKKTIKRLNEIKSQRVVVSQFIRGKSASVQVCITKYGIFSLPLQQQVISQSDLVATTLPGADSFNGGQWSTDDFSEGENKLAKTYANHIGKKLQEIGYKGIFGIDLLIAHSGVYVIEVNARITGMTAVITAIQKSLNQIPFLLLHTLEHVEIDYHLTHEEVQQIHDYSWKSDDYGYAIIFNNSEEKKSIQHTLSPGIYELAAGNLKYISATYALEDLGVDQYLLLDFPSSGTIVASNKRMGRLLTKQIIISNDGKLIKNISQVIQKIRSLL